MRFGVAVLANAGQFRQCLFVGIVRNKESKNHRAC